MYKYLTSFLVCGFTALSVTTHALDHNFTVSGLMQMQEGVVLQRSEFKTPTPGSTKQDKMQNNELWTDTELYFHSETKFDEDYKAGMDLTLYSDIGAAKNGATSRGKVIKFFLETPVGLFEAGEMSGATGKIKVGAATIAKATGGIDGVFDSYVNKFTIDGSRKDTIFVNSPNLPVGGDFGTRKYKLSYYTPARQGLRLGMSYTPDILDSGTISKLRSLPDKLSPDFGDNLFAYKNILEVAGSYENEISNVMKYTVSLAGQLGEAKEVIDNEPRKGLHAFELGTVLSKGYYSLAGSYGDWRDSGVSKLKQPGKKYGAKFYTLGVAYEDEQFGASVTYFNSRRAGGTRVFPASLMIDSEAVHEDTYNKLKVLSLGTDFKITQGVTSYLEYNHFAYDRGITVLDNDGEIYVVGFKFAF